MYFFVAPNMKLFYTFLKIETILITWSIKLSITSDLELLNDLDYDKISFFSSFFCKYDMKSVKSQIHFQEECKRIDIEFDIARSIYSIFYYIASYVADKTSTEKGLNDFQENFLGEHLENESILKAWNTFKNNFHELNDFVLTVKTHKLTDTQLKLDDFELNCNIRPLFNVERNEILRYFFPIELKLSRNDKDEVYHFELEDVDGKLKLHVKACSYFEMIYVYLSMF